MRENQDFEHLVLEIIKKIDNPLAQLTKKKKKERRPSLLKSRMIEGT